MTRINAKPFYLEECENEIKRSIKRYHFNDTVVVESIKSGDTARALKRIAQLVRMKPVGGNKHNIDIAMTLYMRLKLLGIDVAQTA